MNPSVELLFHYQLVGALLFGIGVVGFLSRRNQIVLFLSVEMMLQGAAVSLVGWGRYHQDWGGQVLILVSITIAACEAAVGLALILMLEHRRGSLDLALWCRLHEDDLPDAAPDPSEEDLAPPEIDWPRLPTAGLLPETPPEDEYRDHV